MYKRSAYDYVVIDVYARKKIPDARGGISYTVINSRGRMYEYLTLEQVTEMINDKTSISIFDLLEEMARVFNKNGLPASTTYMGNNLVIEIGGYVPFLVIFKPKTNMNVSENELSLYLKSDASRPIMSCKPNDYVTFTKNTIKTYKDMCHC